ncbi:MAG: hypothetical protein PWP15_62 [Methanothermococcus sp.]|jgi:hypothetical protein|uniref:hypothetical protein n=1 Tax=Methanothermococcus TaxID=155862 RepID=UPI00036C58B2|nr:MULTISPECIES: hypothetical protein [Methanothermococcus]MDK2789555.1 hypothetical protein [Methanothermococcus sp.]
MYRILLLFQGIIFLNFLNSEYVLLGLLISFLISYFKKVYGLLAYIICLIYASNNIVIGNLFSYDFLYIIIYLIVPSILGLDLILKRDTSFETKYLVFLAPLIFAYLLMYLGIESIESTTLVYVLFLMYAIYLNHLNEVKVSYENQGFSFNFGREVNRTLLLTVFSMVSIPILILYILYVQYPNVLSDARSQCSILIGFSGIMLLIYNLKKVND